MISNDIQETPGFFHQTVSFTVCRKCLPSLEIKAIQLVLAIKTLKTNTRKLSNPISFPTLTILSFYETLQNYKTQSENPLQKGQAINILKLRAVLCSLLPQNTFKFELTCLDSHIIVTLFLVETKNEATYLGLAGLLLF